MAPIEVNGGAAAEKPSNHNKVVVIGSGPAGVRPRLSLPTSSRSPAARVQQS